MYLLYSIQSHRVKLHPTNNQAVCHLFKFDKSKGSMTAKYRFFSSAGRLGRRNGSSGNKRKSRRAMRAMTSLQQEKASVLKKADAIEAKWQKINRSNRNAGDSTSTSKVDSWLHLVRDVLTQSRTSLNTIGEEDKRSSLPWRNRLSRASSLDEVGSLDELKIRSLPKRASYGGASPLNIIADKDEEDEVVMRPKSKQTKYGGLDKNSVVEFSENVVVEKRPKSNISYTMEIPEEHSLKVPNNPNIESRPRSGLTPRISEEDARANSIESQSDTSDQSETGSTSRTPSVTFSNNHEYITNFREAGSRSVPAPDDVFEESS